MAAEDRSTEEVYRDILYGIESIRRAGKRLKLYAIGRRAMLPNSRLRDRLPSLPLRTADAAVPRGGIGGFGSYGSTMDSSLPRAFRWKAAKSETESGAHIRTLDM